MADERPEVATKGPARTAAMFPIGTAAASARRPPRRPPARRVEVQLCEMPECPREAVVGWGNPVRWCCLEHYQYLLRQAAKVLDRLIREAGHVR